MEKINNKINDNSKIRQIYIFLASVSIYLSFVFLLRDLLIPTSLQDVFNLITLIIGYFAIVLWLLEKRRRHINKAFRNLLYIWIILVILMIIRGLFQSSFSAFNIGWAISQDYKYVMYVTMAFMFSEKENWNSFEKMMKIIGVVSIITGIIAVLLADKTLFAIETRANTWTVSYYLWWFSSSCFAYWFYYAFCLKKNTLLGVSVTVVYVVYGLIVLKRAVIINLITMIIFTFLLKKKNNRKVANKFMVVFILLFIVIAAISFLLKGHNNSTFSHISEILFQRFDTTASDMSNWDRTVEWKLYLEKATILDILFGQGIGNYVYIETQWYGQYLINAIHIGLYNILYKGGVLYQLFNIILIANCVKLYRRKLSSPYALVCIGVGFSYSVSLFFEMSWTYIPIIFVYMVPMLQGLNLLYDKGEYVQ